MNRIIALRKLGLSRQKLLHTVQEWPESSHIASIHKVILRWTSSGPRGRAGLMTTCYGSAVRILTYTLLRSIDWRSGFGTKYLGCLLEEGGYLVKYP